MKICNVPNCGKQMYDAGLCEEHYGAYFSKVANPAQENTKSELGAKLKNVFSRNKKDDLQEAIKAAIIQPQAKTQQEYSNPEEEIYTEEIEQVEPVMPRRPMPQPQHRPVQQPVRTPVRNIMPQQEQEIEAEHEATAPVLDGVLVSIERKFDTLQGIPFAEIKIQLYGENNFPGANILHMGNIKLVQVE